jgi:L-threonylcarbamoyladenylate synthase
MNVADAINILNNDGVVVLPTDTVWGIGCKVGSKEGLKRLYQIKKREPGKPTALLVSSMEMTEKYGRFNAKARELINKYWPGGLTVVVEATENVPDEVMGGEGKVGIRMPDHKIALELITGTGEALVASSANFAGLTPPKTKEDMDPELVKMIDGMVEGEAGGEDPSTVVEVEGDFIRIIRQGMVDIEIGSMDIGK